MEVKDAAAATEIVRQFLERLGVISLFLAPIKAERTDGLWVVELIAGIKHMRFEINASTGQILRYAPVT